MAGGIDYPAGSGRKFKSSNWTGPKAWLEPGSLRRDSQPWRWWVLVALNTLALLCWIQKGQKSMESAFSVAWFTRVQPNTRFRRCIFLVPKNVLPETDKPCPPPPKQKKTEQQQRALDSCSGKNDTTHPTAVLTAQKPGGFFRSTGVQVRMVFSGNTTHILSGWAKQSRNFSIYHQSLGTYFC